MRNKYLTNIIENAFIDARRETRAYIGASSIGLACQRSLWYGYQGYERLPKQSKQQRTLNIGKILESLVIDLLISSGLDILQPAEDNDFLRVQDRELKEFQGHLDAIWIDRAIVEIKTAKDSSFRIFEKSGLMKWYPVYYAQIQSYMGMSNINKAYVIAINKDTSELHDEEVDFDERYYLFLREKAKKIIEATGGPPVRISENPLYFGCKQCDFRKVCHDTR